MTLLDFLRDTRIALQEIRDAARPIVASDGDIPDDDHL